MIDDTKKEIITLFYRELLNREPDVAGFEFYMSNDLFLETVYYSLKESDECKQKKEERKRLEREHITDQTLPITLTMFVKDAEDSVAMAINSVKSIVREVVILDTGSTDNTVEICKELGALVYKCGMLDFGSIRTLTARLSRQEWILGLDADEHILEGDLHKFRALVEREDIDIWGLPRKRWADLDMTEQLEKDIHPDWQYRFFRNKPEIHYTRRVHEIIQGSDKREEADNGPCIQHFQDVFKSGDKLITRNLHYKGLYYKDIKDGVEHDGKAVEDLDER